VSELVLGAFVRIATHPRVLVRPATLEAALEFAEGLRRSPTAVPVAPGPRHWDLFADLCRAGGVRGSLVTDAYLAALAIESGCDWITTDRDFARFPELRWRHPFDPQVGSSGSQRRSR
jgi:toxin-antitoxin system PIN domain toxin